MGFDELSGRLSLSAHSDASRQVHFFELGEKFEKPLVPALPAKPAGELPDEDREKVHAANHRELKCQSASTKLVLEENPEDFKKLHDHELECQ